MSIDAITEKIIHDAHLYSDQQLLEAALEYDQIIRDANIEAESIAEKSTIKSANDAAAIINKVNSAAELEARKMRLEVKQKELAKALDSAIDRIANMDSKEYIAFLGNAIVKTGVREGELLLNDKDRKAIGRKLLKTANDMLGDGNLKLSTKTIDAKGGFVIISNELEIDSRLETMVYSIKDKIAGKIVAMLFHR